MENITNIFLGIVGVIIICIIGLAAMDREVARRDFVKNVEICKPIDGCLFDSNCNHYNEIIEKECE